MDADAAKDFQFGCSYYISYLTKSDWLPQHSEPNDKVKRSNSLKILIVMSFVQVLVDFLEAIPL